MDGCKVGDLDCRITGLEGGSENSRKARMDKDESGSRHVAALAGIVRGVEMIIVGSIRTWMAEQHNGTK